MQRDLGSRLNCKIEEGRYSDHHKYGAEGIYRGKSSTPLRDIHVEQTYTVGKALSIFLESVHFGFLGNLFGLREHRRQNLIKVI